MKKTFLIFTLLTLALGFSFVPLDSFALSEEEENYVDSLLTSNKENEFDYYNCVSGSAPDEFTNCLEASEDYVSPCEDSDSEKCEVSPDYDDGDEEFIDEESLESERPEDPDFVDAFSSAEEEFEEETEEEFNPASIIPVAVVVFLGLIIIIVLNLL